MKKINLKGISEVLSEKELKNVMGGSGASGCESLGTPCTITHGYPGKCIQDAFTSKMYCSTVN